MKIENVELLFIILKGLEKHSVINPLLVSPVGKWLD